MDFKVFLGFLLGLVHKHWGFALGLKASEEYGHMCSGITPEL